MCNSTQCERCGAEFSVPPRLVGIKRFCSERCRKAAEKRRLSTSKVVGAMVCAGCSAPFSYHRRRKYCSDRCRTKHLETTRPARSHVSATACVDCGTAYGLGWWVGRIAKPGAASGRCHACYLAYTRRRQSPNGPKPPPKHPRCISCRGLVKGVDARCKACFPLHCHLCGAKCHSRSSTPTCVKCADRNRPPAMRKRAIAVRNGDKGISWRTIAERDGWRCHLCGAEVEQCGGTAHEPKGATVDHIIPIALGGTHTWDNVALAHRRCNISRGARPLAA